MGGSQVRVMAVEFVELLLRFLGISGAVERGERKGGGREVRRGRGREREKRR